MKSDDKTRVTLDKTALLRTLAACSEDEDIDNIRAQIKQLQKNLPLKNDGEEQVSFREDILLADLAQIMAARTLERMHHYITRLRKGATAVSTSKINNINLNRWKEYDDIITDSLWMMDRRDSSGLHKAWYWGNFIPQIPHQLMTRYTQQGDWVLDTFAGSGTTLIECRRMGRNGLGIELNPEIAARARDIVQQAPNPQQIHTEIVQGNSVNLDYENLLRSRDIEQVQLLLMHPPYHDIIRFSDDEQDLSNSQSVDDFVEQFTEIVRRTYAILESERYLAVVIGDKYVKGEWIPLGFYLMQSVMAQGYLLKSIVVKNFDETRAKRAQKELWRYRALVGGFYVFKHEYVFLFQKRK